MRIFFVSVSLSVSFSVSISFYQSVSLSISLSLFLSVCLSFYQSVSPLSFSLSFSLSLSLSRSLSLSDRLPLTLSLSPSLSHPLSLTLSLSPSLSHPLSLYRWLYTYICLSVCLFVYFSVCNSFWLLSLWISPVFLSGSNSEGPEHLLRDNFPEPSPALACSSTTRASLPSTFGSPNRPSESRTAFRPRSRKIRAGEEGPDPRFRNRFRKLPEPSGDVGDGESVGGPAAGKCS